jgi:hypothetical protein
MIPPIPALDVAALAARWWKAALGLVLGAVLVFPVARCAGHADGVKDEKAAETQRLEAAKARNAVAVARSDVQRADDQRDTAKLEEDLRSADDATPDSKPSDARLALACQRLRARSARLADTPECRGLAGRTQAAARP